MSLLVDLKHISWATPDGRSLLDGLTLAFGNERTGLVGRNGSGKSTLLRLIAGDLMPASGTISRAGTIGVLRQRLGTPDSGTVATALGAEAGLTILDRIEHGQASEDDFAGADWSMPERAAAALAAMGLDGIDTSRPLASLSGGQGTRAALAGLLLEAPDMILLDEPTNNLDADGRAAVARLLQQWKGGAIVASHDRALLACMDRIVEWSGLGARIYGGGWSLYAERKQAEREVAERQLDAARQAVRQTSREAQETRERQARRDSRGAAMRSKGGIPKILLDARQQRAERTAARGGALSDRKRAEAAAALSDAERNVEVLAPLRIRLSDSVAPEGRRVLVIENGGWQAPGGRWVLRDLSLTLHGGERIAVTGPNGAGKTTLLRLAAGALAPTQGSLHLSGVAAMLDQQVAILSDDQSVLENCLRLNPAMIDNEARALLAWFMFRNETADKAVAGLSGGERLRAGLACVLGGAAPDLLILDEPTNHLDLDAIAMLEAALADYAGALMLVSHDEAFLEAIGITRRIALS